MPTIGLKNFHVAPRTVSESQGVKSVAFGSPVYVAPLIQVNMDIEYAEGELYGDDILLYSKRKFKSGTLSINPSELPTSFWKSYLGARETSNGIIVDSAEDQQVECACAFESEMANGATRYVWLLRVIFALPPDAYTTKGDSITFNTPTIEGKIMEEIVEDAAHRHVWRYTLDSDSTASGASAAAAAWYNAVPAITFAALNVLTVSAAAGSTNGKTVLTVSGTVEQSTPTLKYQIGDVSVMPGVSPTGSWTELTSGTTEIAADAGALITVIEVDTHNLVVSRGIVSAVPNAA